MAKSDDMSRFQVFCQIFEKEVIAKKAFTMIGGYDLAGAYCNWLLKHLTACGADMIIDDALCAYGIPIFRELALDDVCHELYAGIVPNDRKYEEMFIRHDITPFCLEDIFGCKEFGYYQWLEAKYGAIGVAYKPNPNFMVSASTSIGKDQNAYNAGVSLKFGKGETAKTKAELQKQVKYLDEKNKAQDELIKQLLERIEKLENK